MLSQDLMGLGLPGPLAARLANGGTGPVTIAAAGNANTNATKIMAEDYIVYVNSGSGGVILPTPSPTNGADGPLIYDDYTIHSAISGNCTVYFPSGVTCNIGGAQYSGASGFALAQYKTLTIYTGPSSTQWFGISA